MTTPKTKRETTEFMKGRISHYSKNVPFAIRVNDTLGIHFSVTGLMYVHKRKCMQTETKFILLEKELDDDTMIARLECLAERLACQFYQMEQVSVSIDIYRLSDTSCVGMIETDDLLFTKEGITYRKFLIDSFLKYLTIARSCITKVSAILHQNHKAIQYVFFYAFVLDVFPTSIDVEDVKNTNYTAYDPPAYHKSILYCKIRTLRMLYREKGVLTGEETDLALEEILSKYQNYIKKGRAFGYSVSFYKIPRSLACSVVDLNYSLTKEEEELIRIYLEILREEFKMYESSNESLKKG